MTTVMDKEDLEARTVKIDCCDSPQCSELGRVFKISDEQFGVIERNANKLYDNGNGSCCVNHAAASYLDILANIPYRDIERKLVTNPQRHAAKELIKGAFMGVVGSSFVAGKELMDAIRICTTRAQQYTDNPLDTAVDESLKTDEWTYSHVNAYTALFPNSTRLDKMVGAIAALPFVGAAFALGFFSPRRYYSKPLLELEKWTVLSCTIQGLREIGYSKIKLRRQ